MKRKIATATLGKRLPRGFTLPRNFSAFVAAASTTDPARHGFFNIQWTNPADFGLCVEARTELVPFLRLGDGGIVAFWVNISSTAPAIIHLDSEGGAIVAATEFNDFLVRFATRKTGIPDIDEAEESHPLPGRLKPACKPAKIAPALRAAFKCWLKENSDTYQPVSSATDDLEHLRMKLHLLAVKMLRSGFSKVYKVRDNWWMLDFQVARDGQKLEIKYLDYGDWKRLPATLGAEPLFQQLLANVKHPKRTKYTVVIVCNGLVSVDKDKELVLEAPKKR